jgi:hypothetical protein
MERVTLLQGTDDAGEDVWIDPKLILWTRRINGHPSVARVFYQAGHDVENMTCYLYGLRQVMEVIE